MASDGSRLIKAVMPRLDRRNQERGVATTHQKPLHDATMVIRGTAAAHPRRLRSNSGLVALNAGRASEDTRYSKARRGASLHAAVVPHRMHIGGRHLTRILARSPGPGINALASRTARRVATPKDWQKRDAYLYSASSSAACFLQMGTRLSFIAAVSKSFSGVHGSATSAIFLGISKFTSLPLQAA